VGLQETHGIELHVTEKEEPQPDPWPALIWPASLAGRGFDFFFVRRRGGSGLVFFFLVFRMIKAQKRLTFPSRF
jgi:hypothetical protein